MTVEVGMAVCCSSVEQVRCRQYTTTGAVCRSASSAVHWISTCYLCRPERGSAALLRRREMTKLLRDRPSSHLELLCPPSLNCTPSFTSLLVIFMEYILLALILWLFGYLLYAMLRPERF
ncbi:MAG: K(+)-transporting ATPase subunit F [Gammaproteobacteria bacterium]|nr:K(+)-transporting ATPase subunit F [Gammaproteobacteria bacterium]